MPLLLAPPSPCRRARLSARGGVASSASALAWDDAVAAAAAAPRLARADEDEAVEEVAKYAEADVTI